MSSAERLAAWLLLLAATLLTFLGGGLPLTVTVGAWAALLIAIALRLRRFWHWLFGPVFFYDLICLSRRGRYFAVRCGYASLLLAGLFFYYNRWFPGSLDNLFEASALLPSEKARFAEGFFTTFLIGQFAAVLVLTPLFTAGAITDEKEQRTFEYLLTTDLHNREIVLGKLGARLAQLTLLVFTGLPVLSLLQFMGGVDPELVLAGSLGTAVTVLSTASLSIAVSVLSRTTVSAVFATYVCIAGYLVFTSCLGASSIAFPAFNLGNPYYAYLQLESSTDGSGRAATFTAALIGYCAAHGALALIFGMVAVEMLRGPALEPSRKQAPPRAEVVGSWGPIDSRVTESPWISQRRRPPVGDNALWWKETNDRPIVVEEGTELPKLVALIVIVGMGFLVMAGIADSLHEGGGVLTWPSAAFWEALRALNLTVRGLGTGLACLMFFLIAVNAAGRVSREWEKHTLAGLLTLPLERGDILGYKWLASIMHVRGLGWGLGLLWLAAFLSGGPTFMGLPCMLLWWFVYAAFVAVLGLWFSVVTRSTLRATLWTPLAVLAIPAGAWVGLDWTIQFLVRQRAGPQLVGAVELFQQYGLSPPMALWVLSSSHAEAGHYPVTGPFRAALAGIGFYGCLTLLLWKMSRARFRILTNEAAEPSARAG